MQKIFKYGKKVGWLVDVAAEDRVEKLEIEAGIWTEQ